MAANYVYTDLSVSDALQLTIEGVNYEVAQFTASYAVNEVPTAICLLAIGRNVRTRLPAAVHRGFDYRQMLRATVRLHPVGGFAAADLDTDTPPIDWPADPQIIFDGFVAGFAYRKVLGKVHAVLNLIGWPASLGFSSCLTRNGHVANPTQMNAAAILTSFANTGADGAGPAGLLTNVSSLTGMQFCAPAVSADLWNSVKALFCNIASVDTMPAGPAGECRGDGTYASNDAALNSLKRFEGAGTPASDCDRNYDYGVPLKFDTGGLDVIADSVGLAIGNSTIASYANTTFLDKLVGEICPMFGMAVVPLAETALVIADVPTYNGGFWKELKTTEYDAFDMTAELPRPLRGVGVIAHYDSMTMPNQSPATAIAIGGCYVEDSVTDADGLLLFVSPPAWLANVAELPLYAGSTTGVSTNEPGRSTTTPVDPPEVNNDVGALGNQLNELYQRYAHQVYVAEVLRGRGGSLSGKLRFDIAPGSIVKIRASAEKFIGAEDGLAQTLYGCVQRVVVSIGADTSQAGTTFVLSHLRTESENGQNRTSTSEHPLFGKSIHGGGKHGAPLVKAYDL